MWSMILTAAMGLLKTVLGAVFGKKDPSAVDLAASNATAQAGLAQEKSANEVLTTAAAAGRDADARILRYDTGAAQVTVDPAAPINKDPEGYYRD